MQENQHLLIYDGECGICDRIVRFLVKADKKRLFQFAPLNGITAEKVLKDLPEKYRGEDTLVLVENWNTPQKKFYILGKGTLRIFWILGGLWGLIGWISFLPGCFYDWMYRLFARHRKGLFPLMECCPPEKSDRFLP